MISSEKVQDAVRELRKHLKMNQRKFGDEIGKSTPTVQRYEGKVPPVGEALAELVILADQSGRPDIAEIFRESLRSELGPAIMGALKIPTGDPPARRVVGKK